MINSQNKKERISLLKGVGGYLLPGEMAALMGCAGDGGAGGRGGGLPLTVPCLRDVQPLPTDTPNHHHHYRRPLRSPSGSGKTTLLDLLAGRKTVGTLEGDITFAGNKPTPQFLRRFTGYVEQFGERSGRGGMLVM